MAAAALLVAGCGNGEDSDDQPGVDHADEVGGEEPESHTGDEEQREADPEGDEEHEATEEQDEGPPGEPEFFFPSGFEVVVDDDLTGDEETDNLLQDHTYALKAMNESYVQQEGTDNFFRYWTAPIDSDYLYDFDDFADEGWTLVGVERFYAREVVRLEGDRATIEFCADTTDAYGEDLETGELVEGEKAGQFGEFEDFRDYYMELERSDEGHWQVAVSAWYRGSEECARKADG